MPLAYKPNTDLGAGYTAKNIDDRFDLETRSVSNQCRGGARIERVRRTSIESVTQQSTLRLPEVRIVYRKNGIYIVLMGDNNIHT